MVGFIEMILKEDESEEQGEELEVPFAVPVTGVDFHIGATHSEKNPEPPKPKKKAKRKKKPAKKPGKSSKVKSGSSPKRSGSAIGKYIELSLKKTKKPLSMTQIAEDIERLGYKSKNRASCEASVSAKLKKFRENPPGWFEAIPDGRYWKYRGRG
ncbi:MAG: hypothetical protein GWN93_19355 [Deltaproteobacteria bacterium]|nr:hypothetical protein [Deltaproteobacteria bacterium]